VGINLSLEKKKDVPILRTKASAGLRDDHGGHLFDYIGPRTKQSKLVAGDPAKAGPAPCTLVYVSMCVVCKGRLVVGGSMVRKLPACL
jgi:hypothetical protein